MRGAANAIPGQKTGDRASSRNLKILLHLATFLRPYRVQIFFALLALISGAGGMLGLGLGLRYLVDQGLSHGNAELLDQSVAILMVLVLFLAAMSYARFFLVTWLGERVIADLRKALFSHVLTLDPEFYEVTKASEIQSRLTTDTTLLQSVIGSSLSVAARNSLMLAGGLVMLMLLSARLTLIVLLLVPVVLLPIIILGRKVRRLSRESQDRVADVGSCSSESLDAVRMVQAFCHEDEDRLRFDEKVEDAFKVAVRRIRWRAAMTATVMVLVFAGVAAVLWTGGHDMMAGDISSGDLSAFVFYSIMVATAAGAISEVMGELQRAAGATERILELLATQPRISAPAEPRRLPARTGNGGELAFEAVEFRYPARPDWSALRDFSLHVKQGESLALVGPSGAGKTTVFSLLLRFYDPASGRILLDGTDLRALDPREARSRIALVPQDPVVFSTTAWENIRFGKPDASDDEVRAAAEAAMASEFLDRLPDGFDSFLGEKGVRLSGGQRQRLAIARAILRDPEILLLDEATSALDAESERLVQQALEKVMQGRTSLTIAHRLATVRSVDRILVMADGQVIDQGNHESLVAAGGLYAELARLQFEQARGEATPGEKPIQYTGL